jgi:hypothetical protein
VVAAIACHATAKRVKRCASLTAKNPFGNKKNPPFPAGFEAAAPGGASVKP